MSSCSAYNKVEDPVKFNDVEMQLNCIRVITSWQKQEAAELQIPLNRAEFQIPLSRGFWSAKEPGFSTNSEETIVTNSFIRNENTKKASFYGGFFSNRIRKTLFLPVADVAIIF